MDIINGLFVWKPRDNAPSFKKASLSIVPEKLSEWLLANKDKVDAKGYLRIDILESKKGGYYARLDTWKPEKNGIKEEVTEDQIPF